MMMAAAATPLVSMSRLGAIFINTFLMSLREEVGDGDDDGSGDTVGQHEPSRH